ncbi:hypothetical protein LUZ62_083831 [Rhynchospora pubera]|uniref:RING-type E3 ubiquitin transferase n=1 Tax=Rhynchospora pubera TaxID=906938 RepID=A0AAV8C459_9POAL|nr:hypothetical protein LUZ62_083831 [Rhynchospora pubera]
MASNNSLLYFFLLSSLSLLPSSASLPSLCNLPLPLPSATLPSASFPSHFFTISSGSFSGGHPLFSLSPPSSRPNSFSFLAKSSFHTHSPALFRLSGTNILRGTHPPSTNRSLLHLHRVRPRLPLHHRYAAVSFDLDGFWSEPDSLLCMHGPGIILSSRGNAIHSNALLKLNFSKTSTLTSPFVTGTLESSDEPVNPNYFDPVSLVSFAEKNYEYTETSHAKSVCGDLSVQEESRGLGGEFSCEQLRGLLEGSFQLEYGRDCLNGHCDPVRGALGFDQDYMFSNQLDCSDDGKVHMYLVFTNESRSMSRSFMIGEKGLVVEGFWDGETNRLCLVGCDVVASEEDSRKNLSISECSFGLSFWFPSVFSIKSRSVAVGRIWEGKRESKTGNFTMIPFGTTANYMSNLAKLKYKYTKVEVARGFCAKVDHGKKGKGDFPDGRSFRDMRFRFDVKSKEGKGFSGIASPISLGDNFYAALDLADNATQLDSDNGYLNISYRIEYNLDQGSKKQMKISAEGIYNPKSGALCLIGCQYVGSSDTARQAKVNDSMDCEIFINMQLGSLHGKPAEHVKGTIRSLREKSDPLFFDSVEITSRGIYFEQAAESMWRIDVEITMVLISLTFTCLFLGLQLYHLKKNPDFLPFISILMLVILVLGNMIPLVLNFDALFVMRRSKQNILMWSGGWLEVNEVVIRVLTMVNFLLQLRLLQVAWAARSADVSKTGLWVHEKKTIWICLPLYLFGAFIAWLVHTINKSGRHTLWEDLSSYAGLILDGFLLPQVIFNVFFNLKGKALAHPFYIGFTLVRVLPHVYDAYRSRHYVPFVKSSYIYASPNEDIYSLAWDIVVPLGVLILSVVVFLQQRFGGSSFRPLRLRRSGEYEMVPVSSSS